MYVCVGVSFFFIIISGHWTTLCWLIVLSVIFVPALMTPTKSLARLAHPVPMTWRRHCVVFPFDGTIILASGVSMRRTESVNSTPWLKRRATCMKREMVGVAVKTAAPSLRQTASCLWEPCTRFTPSTAPDPTCRRNFRSSSLWKVTEPNPGLSPSYCLMLCGR